MDVRTLNEAEIRSLIDPAQALAVVRQAFAAFARGEATLPSVLSLEFPANDGEAHVKGAFLRGAPYWSVKAATGFFRNPERGLPVTSGVSLVFSASTGFLDTILFDNGYLTELRTGAAGALAADLLAKREVAQATIVGAGGQARYQLEALLLIRRPHRIAVWARRREAATAYAAEMGERLGREVAVADDLQAAVSSSDLIVTATPSRSPLLRADWLHPGTHVTAMGSDFPTKQELDAAVLARADVVAADDPAQALDHGELRHAVAAGVLDPSAVVPLGAIEAGEAPGRTSDEQITVADLTGLGIQDAAVANHVVRRAAEEGVGRPIATSG